MTTEHEQNEADGEVKYRDFVVTFISFSENEVISEHVRAPDWRAAAIKHSETLFLDEEGSPSINVVPEGIDEAREYCFDMDGGFDVLELFIDENNRIDSIELGREVGEDDEDEDNDDDELEPGDETDTSMPMGEDGNKRID